MLNTGHPCPIGLRVLLEFEKCVFVGHLDVGGIVLVGIRICGEACATNTQISFSADGNRIIFLRQSAFDEGFLLADLRRRFFASIVDWSEILARSPVVYHLATIIPLHLLILFLAMGSSRVLGRGCLGVSA